ncbi:hypothetical protein LCGC14_0414380 [marine sediment metagenome]|uniref:Uncharacterized protein n=1 Tax=marine sediment metagenome TaxID=412755 RepID=A0A0F9W1U7_9ZZZZ
MPKKIELSPYQRIMRNAYLGKGVRLNAREVMELSFDEAIKTAAAGDDEQDEEDVEIWLPDD